nr:hypothetical protein [Mycoplasmopsis bovis]
MKPLSPSFLGESEVSFISFSSVFCALALPELAPLELAVPLAEVVLSPVPAPSADLYRFFNFFLFFLLVTVITFSQQLKEKKK